MPTPSPTDSAPFFTGNYTPSTPSHTTRSNDTYVYGTGITTVLAIDACVIFSCDTFLKNKIKRQWKKKFNQQNDVTCFKEIYNKWLVLIGKKALKILSKTD